MCHSECLPCCDRRPGRSRAAIWVAALVAASLAPGTRRPAPCSLAPPRGVPPRPSVRRAAAGEATVVASQDEDDEVAVEEAEQPLDAHESWSPAHELERPALYIVATPIGNLGDITLRALHVLRNADVFYAEDTRSLRKLLRLLGIPLDDRPVVPCHEFNEQKAAGGLVQHLRRGCCAALVSDAGTPLIADPGRVVLTRVREDLGASFPVRTVPGPCAVSAALSVTDLPSERYLFAGFLTIKRGGKRRHGGEGKRRRELQELLQQAVSAETPATLVLYESRHRIVSLLQLLVEALEEEGSTLDRRVSLCRELTKVHEAVLSGTAPEVLLALQQDPDLQRGEFVVLVGGGQAYQAAQAAQVWR
mmetsp:Transcript_45559/g.109040  ORF Transcript_45559/g.109040 Transcript_45559/m.109040 type:complete len:362 (-) Transcript_45559:37-1122(-)